MATWWTLAVTPLSTGAESKTVVVRAENWQGALRAGREELGEAGGVPKGASCVVSDAGDVTILDGAARRRFVLTKTSEPPAGAAEDRPPIALDSQPLAPASEPPLTLVEELPLSEPPPAAAQPAVSARAAPLRKGTMAYSPEESAAIRAQLGAGPKEVAIGAPDAAPAKGPPTSAGSYSSRPSRLARPSKSPGARSVSKETMAYSPEQAAAIRAQLAGPRASGKTRSNAPAKAGAKGTVAYMEGPLSQRVGTSLVLLASRNDEPTATSQLHYRERCFFAPEAPGELAAEAALRAELAVIQNDLARVARGKYVNLAIFDHYFQGSPQRGPVATLEWKDWRGEAVFKWHGAQGGSAALPTRPSAQPPRTSYVPEARASRAPSAAFDTSPGGTPNQRAEQDRRLATAFEAVQDLYFLSSAADGLDFAVKLLSELVPCQAISGCIYDINTDEFRFVAVTGPGAESRKAASIPSSLGLFAIAARCGDDSLVVRDAGRDPRFNAMVDGRDGLVSEQMMYLPLVRADNLLGMLQLINPLSGEITSGDIAAATYVAGQVADFVQAKRSPARR